MTRLIDADRLKRSFEANTPIAFQDCVPGIHAIIDLEPTVEAEAVRHGKWIIRNGGYYEEIIDCSVCERCKWSTEPYENLVRGFKYCPNCGAKMD